MESQVKLVPELLIYQSFKDLEVAQVRKKKNTLFCTKLYDNLIIGPYIGDQYQGCPMCMITTLMQHQEENLLTLFLNDDSFSKLNSDDLQMIKREFLESENQLSFFTQYVQVFNLTTGKFHNYKVIENEYCQVCSRLALDTEYHESIGFVEKKTKKLSLDDYRTKKINDLSSVFNKWWDYESGIFIHKYNDFRSSYINAIGIEVKADPKFTVTGYGRSINEVESYNIALLEAIERYCGFSNRKSKTNLYGSYEELKKNYEVVNPELFVLGGNNSNFAKYTPSLEFYWVKASSLVDKKNVYIPEQVAFFSDPEQVNDNREFPTNRFTYDSSNGIALGSNRAEAVLHGLLEVIERDAFLNLWYSNILPEKIDISLIQTKLDLVIRELESRKIFVHFFKANKDISVPCVVALAEDRNPEAKVKYYLAASANFNPIKAIENAAFEVITSLPIFNELLSVNREIKNRYSVIRDRPDMVETQDDHILYNSGKNSHDLYQRWISKAKKTAVTELFDPNQFDNKYIEEDLQYLVDELKDKFEDIIIIDETPQKVADLSLFAYKCFLLGSQPMYFGVQNERINNKRIQNYTGDEVRERVNHNPHPFP